MRYLAALAALVAAAAAALLRVSVPERRTPEQQRDLERAVADVDRELAADLELMSMFDQTKQAFVLENGQFLAHRSTLDRIAPEAAAELGGIYDRIGEVEAAMERRGPAGSIADADLALVHAWEGDVRAAQRGLRAAVVPGRRPLWAEVRRRLLRRTAR